MLWLNLNHASKKGRCYISAYDILTLPTSKQCQPNIFINVVFISDTLLFSSLSLLLILLQEGSQSGVAVFDKTPGNLKLVQ